MTTEEIVRRAFHAYETANADALHALLSDNFKFSAPPEPLLDKDGYMRRCWPFHAEKPCYQYEEFFVREQRAVVLYTCTTQSGKKIRNAEYFHVHDGKLDAIYVFFGPDIS